jgi:hypothetical protein
MPPLLLVALMAAAMFGLISGLYRFLTRRQREIVQEIRDHAEQNGWQYHKRRWSGNPTTFRIEGHNSSGVPWVLKSAGAGDNAHGWSMELTVRYPTVAGETDVAIIPRDEKHTRAALAASAQAESWVSRVSQTLAGAVHFISHSQESPSGFEPFDYAYQVLLVPESSRKPLVDSALAKKWLNWPGDSVPVHSLLAWRDPFGFVVEARVVGPANWATVSYLLDLGEELVRRMPVGNVPAGPQHAMDRMIGKVVQ